MPGHSSLRGRCLCGAVSFVVQPPFRTMVHCHCSRCRRSTGTAHATNLAVDPAQLEWTSGMDAITRYELPGAWRFGKWFCRHCGCPVPRVSRDGSLAVVPAGALDDSPPIAASDHVFWASRAPWTCPAGDLPTHAEYPPSWSRPAGGGDL